MYSPYHQLLPARPIGPNRLDLCDVGAWLNLRAVQQMFQDEARRSGFALP
jgi:hypothetical protein